MLMTYCGRVERANLPIIWQPRWASDDCSVPPHDNPATLIDRRRGKCEGGLCGERAALSKHVSGDGLRRSKSTLWPTTYRSGYCLS
jgi:hypothetical protein